LQLQGVAHAMAREAGEMHFADLQASRRGLAWRGQPFPEDLDARAFDTKVKMTKLAVRVRDNDIRRLAYSRLIDPSVRAYPRNEHLILPTSARNRLVYHNQACPTIGA
jgi:hypothetical protein